MLLTMHHDGNFWLFKKHGCLHFSWTPTFCTVVSSSGMKKSLFCFIQMKHCDAFIVRKNYMSMEKGSLCEPDLNVLLCAHR